MWVARDRNTRLYLYTNKPNKLKDAYAGDYTEPFTDSMELDCKLYINVTFESGPLEVVLKPVVEESNILETLGNNQVQDILEEMGMIDEDGNCPYTAEEIFKAGIAYAFKQSID